MTLVQIGLPRDRAQAPIPANAVGPPPEASRSREAAEGSYTDLADDPPGLADSLAPASAALALAGGLVLLAPLALLAEASRAALALLVVGLAILALIAVLLRVGVEPA